MEKKKIKINLNKIKHFLAFIRRLICGSQKKTENT